MDSTFGWIGISWWLVVGSISIQSLLPWECCHKLWVQQGARSWDMFWTPILWGHICLVISSFLKWFGYNLEGVWLDIGCTCGYNNWDWRGRSFWFARNLQTYWLLRSSFILMWLPYCHGKCICTSWGWECFRLNTAKLLLVNEVYPFDTVHERQKKSASYLNLSDLGMCRSKNRIHTNIYIHIHT